MNAEPIVENLRHGNVPPLGVRAFYQPNETIEKALAQDLKYISEGGSKTRYICGKYGSGKSLTLAVARDMALERGFATSDVVLDPKITPFHKFDCVYQGIMKGFCVKVREGLQLGGQALYFVLTQWREEMMHGTRRPIDPVMIPELPNFAPLIDFLVEEQNLRPYILNWVMGAKNVPWALKKQFGIKGDVDRPLASSLLSAFGKILHHIAFQGWVITFDEAESIMDLYTSDGRSSAYDLMRNIDENRFGFLRTYMLFAGTPEFFSDTTRGVPSFQALDERISHKWKDVKRTSRSPILWLDPLTKGEYGDMLRKVLDLYTSAYGSDAGVSEKDIDQFIEKAIGPDTPPREVIRHFIAHLDQTAK